MMPPPGLQIYIRPRTALIFDLVTPKFDCFMPLLPRGPVQSVHSCSKYKFCNCLWSS